MTRRRSLCTIVFVCVALLVGNTPTRAVGEHPSDAGVDGDHIFAGVSYASYELYERCEWVRPITIHQQGVSPSVMTRE
ncbi:MAG: hypothetical protein ACO3GH_00485, partial [Ilumatobacteraceae bacterium]